MSLWRRYQRAVNGLGHVRLFAVIMGGFALFLAELAYLTYVAEVYAVTLWCVFLALVGVRLAWAAWQDRHLEHGDSNERSTTQHPRATESRLRDQ